jgi:ribose transport system substrate-binding protein
MNTSPLGSRFRRRASAMAVAAMLAPALILTACSSSSSGSQGGSGSKGLSAAQVSSLQALVSKASAVPAFVPPGPAFDTSKLKGKKLFVMPTASQLPVCNQIASDVVQLGKKFGMSGTNFQNSGGPSAWIPGIQQAISQHYDAIVLICGIDPNLIKPQLQAAKKAGIAIIDSGLGDTFVDATTTSPLVTAQTNVPNGLMFQRSVDVALLDHRSGPFDIFEITSNDVPDGVIMDHALHQEVAKYCPDCHIKSVNIAVPDWATKVQSAVSSALLADPSIKVVIPIFDGEVPPAAAGIRASGHSDVKLYGDYGGTPQYILQMGKGLPMGSDVGPTALWRAYATLDQTMRVLSGAGAVSPDKDGDPSRLWTSKNYTHAADVNGGFGTAFIAGYDNLWGIH